MRRSLILTVAAAVSMVLLAMLVPMAVLLRDYALEDRLSRAALEVQATETVVSGADSNEGTVAAYVERINRGDDGIETSVIYPDPPLVIGPEPGADEARRIVLVRTSGTARVDDVAGGSVVMVPVSLGRESDSPATRPVIRIFVSTPGFESALVRSWAILLLLGIVLLVGALFLADRLGRSFVNPIRALSAHAQALGDRRHPDPLPVGGRDAGPAEVQEVSVAMNRLVDRIEVLLERERAGIADVSHRLRTPMTALRLRVDALADPVDRERLGSDLDELQATVDHVVREARRSEREGLVAATDAVETLGERARFWEPLAEDQGRVFTLVVSATEPIVVRASSEDLQAVLDVLLDNVFSHTPDEAAVTVTVAPSPGGGVRLVVEDGGPGLPEGHVVERGRSGAGSTGLGLSIVDKTATESGGGLSVGTSALGGARIVVELGQG